MFDEVDVVPAAIRTILAHRDWASQQEKNISVTSIVVLGAEFSVAALQGLIYSQNQNQELCRSVRDTGEASTDEWLTTKRGMEHAPEVEPGSLR